MSLPSIIRTKKLLLIRNSCMIGTQTVKNGQKLNLFTPPNHFLNFLEEIVVCWWPRIIHFPFVVQYEITTEGNDLTIGWQKLNLLSYPNSTLAPQSRWKFELCDTSTTSKASKAKWYFELLAESLVWHPKVRSLTLQLSADCWSGVEDCLHSDSDFSMKAVS